MRIAILCLVAAAACAPATATTADPSAPRVQTIRAENIGGSLKINTVTDASSTPLTIAAEDAYRVLPLVYDSLAIPKTWLEPKTFLISSQGFKVRARLGRTLLSKYIDCGGTTQIGPNADNYDVFMTITSRLIPNGTGSTLSTTVDAAARPLSFNQDYARCSSKGTLERRIAELAGSFLAK